MTQLSVQVFSFWFSFIFDDELNKWNEQLFILATISEGNNNLIFIS